MPVAGTWLGHAAEYVRVAGLAGLRDTLLDPVHLYMLPLAAVLAMLAGAGALRLHRLSQVLVARLDEARQSIAGAWRGISRAAPSPGGADPPSPSPLATTTLLTVVLGAAQTVLYLLQENVEAITAGEAAPGLAPVTGVHAGAPLVQFAVAAVLAAMTGAVLARLRRRAVTVRRAVHLARLLQGRLRASNASRPVTRKDTVPPLVLRGVHLWCRPPPDVAIG